MYISSSQASRCVDQGPPSREQLAHDSRLEPVLATILSGALKFSAADLYDAQAALAKLTAQARLELAKVTLSHHACLVPAYDMQWLTVQIISTEQAVQVCMLWLIDMDTQENKWMCSL